MPLFIRWGDLTDKLVGKAARGKRPFVRWPKEIASFKRAHSKCSVGVVMLFAGGLLTMVSMLGGMLGEVARSLLVGLLGSASVAVIESTGVVGFLLAIVGALLYIHWLWRSTAASDLVETVSDLVESLYSEDPHLDLQSAALLTMAAMPVWLKGWTWTAWWSGTSRPYTVERAGVDYLELMRRIEQDPRKYMWSFHGKGFPGFDYRLTGSLKDAVVEIVLLLSSLPDSGEDPDEETEAAVLYTINRLATIDGESFTAAVRRLHAEEEDKKRAEKKAAEDKRKADYNSEIRRALHAANNALDAKADAETDEKYKSIQRGMKRLSKISEESGCAAESAAGQLAEAASLTR